jgi:hypothetical protein
VPQNLSVCYSALALDKKSAIRTTESFLEKVQNLGMSSLLNNLQTMAAQLLGPLVEHEQFKQYAMTFAVIGPLSYIVYKYYIYNLFLDPLNQLPGPPLGMQHLFLFGNIWEITKTEVNIRIK